MDAKSHKNRIANDIRGGMIQFGCFVLRKSCPRRPQDLQDVPNTPQAAPQAYSKPFQIALKRAQDAFKTTQIWPRTYPRRPKPSIVHTTLPSRAQDATKRPHDGPRHYPPRRLMTAARCDVDGFGKSSFNKRYQPCLVHHVGAARHPEAIDIQQFRIIWVDLCSQLDSQS